MPRVLIEYSPEFQLFRVNEAPKEVTVENDYQVIMDMKSSHFRNMKKNLEKFTNDQEALMKFFIQAQESGREIREQ